MGTEIGPYAVVMNQQEPCGVDAREHLPRRGRLCRVPWMPARLVSGSNAISVVGRDGAVDDWKQQLAAFNRRRLVPARPGEGWRGDLDDDRKWPAATKREEATPNNKARRGLSRCLLGTREVRIAHV